MANRTRVAAHAHEFILRLPHGIAHRLSTLRQANRLVVLDRGRIVEVGGHDELMALKGDYFRLYQTQRRQIETDEIVWPPVSLERGA